MAIVDLVEGNALGEAVTAPRTGGVLIIGPVPPPKGGITIHIQRLARLYSEHGISCQLLDESRVLKSDIANIRNLSLSSYLKLLRNSDVVHIHSSNRYLRLLHTVVARCVGRKVLQTVHGHDPRPLPRLCLRAACRLSDVRIAVSDAVSAEIGVPSLVIPAFIGPSQDEDEAPKDIVAFIETHRRQGKTVLGLNASRVINRNGVDVYGLDLLVAAFKCDSDVRAQCVAVVCISEVARDSVNLHQLQDSIRREGLIGSILVYAGDVAFSEVLKRCGIFIRPTSTDGDAISVREALWFGIPTIASDAATRPKGVICFRSRDVSDLTSKILENITTARMPSHSSDCFGEQVVETCKSMLKAV